MMQNKRIPVDDSVLAARVIGRGEPIFFLHADGLDSREFRTYASDLSDTYKVIRMDFRGFGNSELPKTAPYSFHSDILRVMDALHIRSTVMVGHSLGAAHAMDAAITAPERVKQLILFAPGLSGFTYSDRILDGINETVRLAKGGDLDAARIAWLRHPLLSSDNQDVAYRIQEMVMVTSGYRWYGQNQPQRLSPPTVEQLDKLICPIRIVLGENECDDIKQVAQLIKMHGKDVTITWVPGGHMAVMEQEIHVVQLMRQWIAA